MITIDRAALAGALSALNRIVERRNTIPILSHVLLTAAAGRGAALTATDLDIVATANLQAGGEGELALPAETLRQLVQRADGEQVTIDPLDGTARVSICSGRARARLNILPAADFPEWQPRDYPASVEMSGAELADVLGRCAPAMIAGKAAQARLYLAGVYLHDSGDDLVAVATDGARLHRRIVSGAAGGFAGGVIVSDKTVRILAALSADIARVTVEAGDTAIRVTAGGIVVTSKLVDGTYPDYSRVIPSRADIVATAERAAVEAVVERAALVSRAVALEFSAGALAVKASAPDVGDYEETLEIDYAGDARSIGLEARYLLDGLAALDGERIEFSVDDAGSPVLLTAPGDTKRLAVVMPRRL